MHNYSMAKLVAPRFIATATNSTAAATAHTTLQQDTVEQLDLSDYRSSPDLLLSEALHAAAFDAASPLGHPLYSACELGVQEVQELSAARAAPSQLVLAGKHTYSLCTHCISAVI
jgi:hypothetical protein